MHLGLLSDTHNSIANLHTAIERFRRFNVETVIHCGDLTSLEIGLQLVEFRLLWTIGNGDRDANEIRKNIMYFRPDNFGGLVYRGEIDGVKVAVTHGHLHGMVDELVQSGEFSYVFHGHSHRRQDEKIGLTRVINPGALGGLKTEPRSFALLELRTGELSYEIIH